jgi:nitrite reductase/ring-hydroxylating ferredoxin subunit
MAEQDESPHHVTRFASAAPGTPDERFRPSRRIVFNGLAALGAAVALAGCGSDNKGGTTSAPNSDSGSSASGGGSDVKAGTELAKTSEVPVNGGLILPDQKVVITQEAAGSFKAFSAVCTHQGFTVTSVEGDVIKCNHHGSQYNAKTGGVVNGPAKASLSPVPITVKGGAILTA